MNAKSISIALIVYLLCAGGSYWYFSQSSTGGGISSILPGKKLAYKTPTANGGAIDESEPKTEACPMNGMMYGASQKAKWESRRPLGIMVENHLDSRPQSGLSNADIIYEAVAEGGITRFLTLFYCEDAKIVGPVRSARMYFIRLLQGYGNNPLYAHVGGANTPGPADALGEIIKLKWNLYNDMNQFSVPFPNFYRDPERLPGVATEHTVYSSTAKLWAYAKDKRGLTNVDKSGESWDTTFTPWTFADGAETADRGTTSKISFGFWDQFASDYGVSWAYDKTTNVYTRSNGGAPHLDKNTGKPLTASNVVIVFAKESPANDGYEGGHLVYTLTGTGDILFFQNGTVTKGTWSKKTNTSRMVFEDAKGKELSMVRGKIFVHILPIGNDVEYN